MSPACGVTTIPEGGWSIASGVSPSPGTGPPGDHTSGEGSKHTNT